MLCIRADYFAECRDLVHERNARREHRVRRVLREFGAGGIHDQDSILAPHERSVERP